MSEGMTPIRNLARTFADRLLERIGLGRVFGGVPAEPAPAPEEEAETPSSGAALLLTTTIYAETNPT